MGLRGGHRTDTPELRLGLEDSPVLSVHQNYPRFLCRLAVAERCAETPAPPGLGSAEENRRTGITDEEARSRDGRAQPEGRLKPAGRMVRLGRGATPALLLALALSGCAPGDPGEPGAASTAAEPDLRFDGAAPTLDVLGEQVLTALRRGDRVGLQLVRLTEYEHNEVVWPELPAAATEVGFPLDYAWRNIENRNARGIERIIPLFEDRDVTVHRVECRGETEHFETFHVLTDCWVVFAAQDSLRLFEAQLFKDVLVRGGGHKIFRYYDEEPRAYTGGRATRP